MVDRSIFLFKRLMENKRCENQTVVLDWFVFSLSNDEPRPRSHEITFQILPTVHTFKICELHINRKATATR